MPIVHPLARHIVLPACFREIRAMGQEHLPATGATILAPTHRSRWDPLVLSHATGRAVSGRDLRFMTTATETTGIQGWFACRLGAFPIDLKRPGIGSLRHGLDLLHQGEMLTIFPEGGIFHQDTVSRLKPGLGRLAMQAECTQPGLKVRVLPVAIRYSTGKPRWGCDAIVNIGKPIWVKDYPKDSTKRSAKKLTADLSEALQDLYDRAI